jgi:hypothetical protein
MLTLNHYRVYVLPGDQWIAVPDGCKLMIDIGRGLLVWTGHASNPIAALEAAQ